MRDTDDFIKDVQDSLADEVNSIDIDEPRESYDDGNGSGDIPRDYRMTDSKKDNKKKKKKHTGFKVFLGIIFAITLVAAALVFTPQGRKVLISAYMKYAYTVINKAKPAGGNEKTADKPTLPTADPSRITSNIDVNSMSPTFQNAKHQDGVFNILLLGVEAIGSTEYAGHTDSIMILTINTNTKELGLTSLMRDTYVSVPGEQYYDGRINGVYRQGGISLLYETIAENYDIRLDGCALVGFDAFRKVIDAMGGINIKLTDEEARYLNTTNYISKKRYRTMKPGWNHMNGYQALGFARIRKIPTLGGTENDEGRTLRHRRVMRALYSRLKKDPFKAVGAMNAILPLVETDVTENNAGEYLAEIVELALAGKSVDQLRLPEGSPDGTQYQYATINGAAVVQVVDWDSLRMDLANFIFAPHESGNFQQTKE